MAKRAGHGGGRDYDVGYGRPPQAHRFQPGKSGNPKGRPKGSVSVASLFKKWGERRVNLVIDGEERRMPALEAMVVQMINRGLKGDPKTVSEIFRWLDQIEADRGSAAEVTNLIAGARQKLAVKLENLARRRSEA
jgi:hypothetical protein